jgi:2'-5' RNA ligase
MRLFVAVNLPADLRQALWDAAGPLRQRDYPVRWVAASAMHLTLKFLGEVDEGRAGELARSVSAVAGGARRFTLPLGGFGAFPVAEHPKVVWAGCDAVPPLELLQHDVERAMHDLGFPLEGRPFRPHLTLGRVKDGAKRRDFAGFAATLNTLRFAGEAMVTSVDLMQSTLSPKGATYTARHLAPLAE